MDIKITPTRLSGTMDAVSSKSFVHRLLICAALSHKETRICINGTCEDIFSTIRCIETMGGSVKVDRTELLVTPMNRFQVDALAASSSKGPPPPIVLRCGESGATARFMLPLAAYFFDNYKLVGEGKLPHRPFAPLCRALASAGCKFDGDLLPITGTGGIKTGNFEIAGNVSSQFISGLLFLLPLLDADSSITITTPMESAGYVNMTAEIIALFGIAVEKKDDTYRIIGNRRYDSPGIATAEGDWSNAAFFLCMGALGDENEETAITMNGLYMRSEQGDKAVIKILQRFGANIEINRKDVITISGGVLRATDIDAAQIPDLIPTLAVVAAVAEGETRIFNAQRLRLKESDRIQSTFDLLSCLGADIEITEDGLLIRGKKKLNGGTVDGAGDHRIVMAAATASCVCENPVIIKGFGAVNKSYPSFFGNFKLLGGVADVF
ncbi:MAG: 3-phosphoshikimate 1-carboxyvinyltransferase [Treponema sp.]|nr:3-phosphoshikimate 1-carboxyvinyltransferase [Treponema sp.]